MRSLPVLNMMDMSSNISFNGVGEMVNLRFLRFRLSRQFIPTLGNLQNLHTLDLTRHFDVILKEVVHMKTLRHLLMSSFDPLGFERGLKDWCIFKLWFGWMLDLTLLENYVP